MALRGALRRDLFAAFAIAFVASGLIASPPANVLRGLSLDILVPLRHVVFGLKRPPSAAPVAIVALDEETYRTPPFAGTPKVFWTPQIGAVIEGLHGAGAVAIGVDLIYPTSLESYLPGFERPYLRGLRRASEDGRLVLAKVQHRDQPIAPSPAQSFAVGHGANIRSVNLPDDADGVIRDAALMFRRDAAAGGGYETTFALELAARAKGSAPVIGEDGSVTWDGMVLADDPDGTIPIAFPGTTAAYPAYSFGDIVACVERGESDFLRTQFAGKVVLIGGFLDEEDRRLTSQRFSSAREQGANGPRCALPPPEGLGAPTSVRDAIPGVFIHAAVIDNLLNGEIANRPGGLVGWLIGFAIALAATGMARAMAPPAAAGAFAALAAGWTAAAILAFQALIVLPLLPALAAGGLGFAAMAGFRIMVTDRDKRRLRRMFGLYLSAKVIDRMVESGRIPELGGEEREVTVFFSDLAGFTRLSEGRTPSDLVELLNRYLSAMTDVIEEHGGFVDKYIGDAIVAVFGAPYDAVDHAAQAVRAAIACGDRLASLNREFAQGGEANFGQRIGINSGTVLVGNIGSHRRFNYTVMGDAVNLASRLEGANKAYGTEILVSEATALRCGTAVPLLEIDRITVVGRTEPVTIFVPLRADQEDSEKTYGAALSAYRAGRFDEAARSWAALVLIPGAAAMADRAAKMAAAPPTDWNGVTSLIEK